ncbi:hypothetical protein SNEBB_005311 [Seison nebaliae]|nr:hypothetical protein SNEBB_005311 [Seison nebaliae]
MNFFIFSLIFFCINISENNGEVTTTVNPNCVKEDGTAQDCNSEEAKAEGRTECCNQGNDIGCCKPGETKKQLIIIMSAAVSSVVFVGTIVFISVWCKKETFPCVGKLEKKFESFKEKIFPDSESLVKHESRKRPNLPKSTQDDFRKDPIQVDDWMTKESTIVT